jgi:hypothetical protein
VYREAPKEKEEARRAKEETKKRAKENLAALTMPPSKGVGWVANRSKWEVTFCFERGGRRASKHLGYFDDHTKAVAEYMRHGSTDTAELEAL